ncbi:MAG: NAD(P)-dependent oxidoreductase [bacterium]
MKFDCQDSATGFQKWSFAQNHVLLNKHIFLTGGTGFFGKSILQWLIDSEEIVNETFSLTVLSRNPFLFLASYPQFSLLKNLSFIQGDVRTFDFPKEKFDVIIHVATPASATLEQQNPEEMRSIVVDGTRHVLDFAKQCECKRFLMTSSGAVYGVQPPELTHIPETFPCNPVTAYGKGKFEAEQMCIEVGEKQGFAALLLRCFAFVGPYLPLDEHFAIGNFMSDCLHNRPIIINGDGTPLRSYLYATDLVEWLWTILLRGEHGKAYNVGSDDAISISDLAHLVRQCAGTDNEIIVKGEKIEGALPARYVPSVDRAKKELGLSQHVALVDAIRRTIEYQYGLKHKLLHHEEHEVGKGE